MSERLTDKLKLEHGTPPRGSVNRAPRWGEPKEQPETLSPSPHTGEGRLPGWDGPTYYGRSQLKPAPFNNWIVGGYIFLAGLSGSSALLSGLADAVGGRRFEPLVRRARWLAALAPTVGSALLIWDLHTPKRFYNMLRVAKATSPMSIGTWILLAFSAGSLPAAFAQLLADVLKGPPWLRTAARVAHAPAAVAGAGLSVYTASLLSATSTPTWAAAPRSLAVRYAASSVASGASALLLGERDPDARCALETVAAAALALELGAAVVHDRVLKEKGLGEMAHTPWGRAETWLATGLGAAVPLALLGLSLGMGRRRPRALADVAAVAALGGSALLRVAMMAVGDESASRPEVSFRFSQPKNLPKD